MSAILVGGEAHNPMETLVCSPYKIQRTPLTTNGDKLIILATASCIPATVDMTENPHGT